MGAFFLIWFIFGTLTVFMMYPDNSKHWLYDIMFSLMFAFTIGWLIVIITLGDMIISKIKDWNNIIVQNNFNKKNNTPIE